ncbi:MAG: DUF4062 domain-containing protein [Chloroflexota bacterium]
MVYKIYISTSQDNQAYLSAVQQALFSINELALSSVNAEQAPIDDSRRLQVARTLVREAKVFIGLYDATYGKIPAGETESYESLEYQEAVAANKAILIFAVQGAYQNADERQKAFLHHVMQNQVVTRFTDADDLVAKVKLSLDTYRETQKHRKLRPLSISNLRENLPPLPDGQIQFSDTETSDESTSINTEEDFAEWVDRALLLAEDEIENIVRRALELHSAQQQVMNEPGEDYDNKITVAPLWGEPIRRSQFQSDIFMIMPFREPYNSVYTEVIRPLAADLNMTIKRGDEFASTRGSIMQEVWAALNSCRLVIAETTMINANVYYELGIAHTLGKPVILLTQTKEVEELPFDIRGLRFTVYEDSATGSQDLEKNLRKTIIWLMNDLEEQGLSADDV